MVDINCLPRAGLSSLSVAFSFMEAAPASAASIFVTIPSYRDSETQHTIRSLYQHAQHPERIFVGVVLQYDVHNDHSLLFSSWPSDSIVPRSHLRLIHLSHIDAKGPCWARYLAQRLYRGEDYYLSLDSHMRFTPAWDARLIQLLSLCPSSKAILTTYPSDYTLPDNLSSDTRPIITCAHRFVDDDPFLRFLGRRFRSTFSYIAEHTSSLLAHCLAIPFQVVCGCLDFLFRAPRC